MELLTSEIRDALLANGRLAAQGEDIDPLPVVKLFTPDANATWLLTEVDIDDPDLLFGLCDLGVGSPELGCVSLAELRHIRGAAGMAIERDLGFKAKRTLSAYAREAVAAGYIAT